MKVEALVFGVVAVFLAVVTPIYWFASNDPTGTTALAVTFGLGAMIAFYFMLLVRRLGPRPEDRHDGEIEELAGEYGFFSPHSWWPLMGGLAASVVFLGLVFAWFILIIGVALAAIAVIGWVFEYYRGEYSH
ncbi:cytochrome c oxidase subunit 4 [Phytoactinopolyspora halotolerans]|uniref:Cytochrome c oxidase polypeptide 4 n=1 Tax=Phytoactinopolyspora halotolerans TaxID=1981512 RepID=A0A6L9S9R8_9ACTN|nr:cytochrome c oxidase subunit 4 [Phytoactinopolyspora halotolerans]NEE01783.1 cytochrome c oxidase subunit 4 [Phytoactinopolyspora halotolerans]